MKVTWRKWLWLLAAALLLTAACHFASWRYFSDVEVIWPAMARELRLGVNMIGPRPLYWHEDVVQTALDHAYAPWPLSALPPGMTIRRFDAENPPQDAETIMGLALIGPVPEEPFGKGPTQSMTPQQFDRYFQQQQLAALVWFDRLSRIAIARAEDDQTRRQFQRLVLLVQNAAIRHRGLGKWWAKKLKLAAASQPAQPPATAESQLAQYVLRQSKAVDPANAVYVYDEARRELESVTARVRPWYYESTTAPAERQRHGFRLNKGVQLVPLAERIDRLLSRAEALGRRDVMWAYRARLRERAYCFRYPSMPTAAAETLTGSGGFSTIWAGDLSGHRSLVERLGFLGDLLTESGQDKLALRMYRHAHTIGEGLVGGKDSRLIDVMVGMACLAITNHHLMGHWATRAEPQKVLQIGKFDGELRHTVDRVRTNTAKNRIDPLWNNDEAFVSYLRCVGLTWWLGVSGVAMLCVSLLAALVHLLLRRGRHISATPLLPAKRLLAVTAVPIVAILWLALLIPLDLGDISKLGAVVVWALVLSAAWIIVAGMVCRGLAAKAADARKSATGWLWPVVGLAAAGAGATTVVWADPPVSAAAAIGCFAAAAAILLWCAAAGVNNIVRRTPADQAYRAAAGKTFAVCSGFVAVVVLGAVLASMPLTRFFQGRYYDLTAKSRRDELKTYVGGNLDHLLRMLPPELLSDAAEQPDVPTTGDSPSR